METQINPQDGVEAKRQRSKSRDESTTKPKRPRRSHARPKPSSVVVSTTSRPTNEPASPLSGPSMATSSRAPADPYIQEAQIRVQELLTKSSTTSLRSTRNVRTQQPSTTKSEESKFSSTQSTQMTHLNPELRIQNTTENAQYHVSLTRSSPPHNEIDGDRNTIGSRKNSVEAHFAAHVPSPGSRSISIRDNASQRTLAGGSTSQAFQVGSDSTKQLPPLPLSSSEITLADALQSSLFNSSLKDDVAPNATPVKRIRHLSGSNVTLMEEDGVAPQDFLSQSYSRSNHGASAGTGALASARTGSARQLKKSSSVLSILNEERKRQREQNRNYFRTRVWDPALQKDFDGAYRLAHDGEDESEVGEERNQDAPAVLVQAAATPTNLTSRKSKRTPTCSPNHQQEPNVNQNTVIQQQPSRLAAQGKKEKPSSNRISRTEIVIQRAKTRLLKMGPPPLPPQLTSSATTKRLAATRPVTWVDAGPAAEDWARAVQAALASLELRIAREDPYSFLRFIPGKRESVELRAWRAEVRRTPEARLSALAFGQALPSSPFEEAFVAELLRENEELIRKHGGNLPGHWNNELSESVDEVKSGLGNHPGPAPHTLPPIPVADDRQTLNKEANRPTRKRQSNFAGQTYKSFSTYSFLDENEGGCCSCFGFTSKKRK